MNPARLQRTLASLTGTARKVYEAVPIETAWSAAAIYGELRRHGWTQSMSITEGCLFSLVDDGLIKRVQDTFTRVRFPTPVVVREVPEPEQETTMPLPKELAFAQMANLAERMRAHARAGAAMADELDDLALQSGEELERARAGNEKLVQLQALLKSIGGS